MRPVHAGASPVRGLQARGAADRAALLDGESIACAEIPRLSAYRCDVLTIAVTCDGNAERIAIPLTGETAQGRSRLGSGRRRTRRAALMGDDAYSSLEPGPAARQAGQDRDFAARGPGHVAATTRVRAPDFDAVSYKGRNVVERSFNDHKQRRGLATRYDKLATTYRGGLVLRAISPSLHNLGDTPWNPRFLGLDGRPECGSREVRSVGRIFGWYTAAG